MNFHSGRPPQASSLPPEEPSPRYSVRVFLIWLVLASLLPGVIGATILFVHEYRQGRAQLEKDTLQTARALAQAADNYLLKVRAVAQALASSDALAKQDLPRFYRQAREVVVRVGLGSNVALVGEDGRHILNTGVEFGRPLPFAANRELVRGIFAAGKPAISDVFVGSVLKRPVISVDVPVYLEGKVAYALGIGILPEHFDVMLQAQGLPAGRIVSILDNAGHIVARSPSAGRFTGEKAPPAFLESAMEADEGAKEVISKDGVPLLFVYTRSPLTGWRLGIGIPREALDAPLLHTLSMLALGVASLFALGLGLAWLMGGRIARSFQALMAPARALGAGETVALPAVEVREAAEAARAMAEAAALLRERSAALRIREAEVAAGNAALRLVTARMQTLTEHAPAAIAVFNREMRYLAVSRRWLENHHLAEEDVIGRCHYDLVPEIPGEWRAAHRRGLAGEVLRADADRLERADGSVQWFRWEIWPWRDDAGAVRGIVIAAEEITEQKRMEAVLAAEREAHRQHLEQQVAERTAELVAANQELEAFTFATSHDLKAPLGRINSFSTLLERNYRDRLDGDGLLFLDLIRQNSIRLTHLVDDLLAHARVAQQTLELQPIDLAASVRGIVQEKAQEIREKEAQVRLELPPVRVLADPHALQQALGNLVENALKYSAGQAAAPRIEVGGELRGDCFRLWVRDNGIGFKMEYHDKIFKMFQRLHTYNEYAGSGVGLALVKRAAERMGGKVWAESAPGQGATFFMELRAAAGCEVPAAQDA